MLLHIRYNFHMGMIKIDVYKTLDGKSPYYEWLDDLDINIQAIIEKRMTRVRLGNFGDHHNIKGGKGIYELIFDFGPGYRIYYGKKGLSLIILLMGGDKGSQKRDITKAKRYWQECEELLHE